ncbi:ankyrin repeat domain-containing protein [Fodinicola acaciae]|uniref:ankyrin repeat domain-containing protein n=1 Tax=Fodinicola acaciae TaxID=2681555 RepID=UPI0013D2A581|nr:ankyrin repeat domain-containing protein [Fodinicola acaciae]
MVTIPVDNPVAAAATAAIHDGRVIDLRRMLAEHPWLAGARVGSDAPGAMSRTLLHVATDWPGHYPRVGATIAALVQAGADVNARFRGQHEETPLHWAASSDDLEALDALLDAGADIDASGAVLGGGTPLADACGFRQWTVARRLVERGARTTLRDAATLGLDDRVVAFLAARPGPSAEEIDVAFWSACHGGRRDAAELLLEAGADVNVVPAWSDQTPRDAAADGGAYELVAWLTDRGGRSATKPGE